MKINPLLRNGILACTFLIPFIPLIVSSSLFFPYIVGKNVAFRVLVELMTLFWVILAVRDPQYRPQKSWVLYAVSALLAAITLATIFGLHPYKSFWSNFERMEGLVTHLHLFLYFIIASSVLLTEKIWMWLLRTSVGASIIMSIYAFSQYAEQLKQGAVGRIDASLGNPTYLAFYMYFHICIIAFLLLREWRSVGMRIVYVLLMILEFLVLYMTATRGALLGLIVAIGVTALLSLMKYWRSAYVRKISVAVLIGLVVLVGGFYLARNSTFIRNSMVLSRFASISTTETTTESRFIIWGMALRGFTEHPIFGWGPENFNILFNKYYESHLWRQEPWFDRSHNVFLDWLITAGILGLASYLALYGSTLMYLWRKETKDTVFPLPESILFTGLLSGYLFQNLFVFDNVVSYILFFTILAYVHSRISQERVSSSSKVHASQPLVWGVTTIVCITFVTSLYFITVRPVLANRALIQGIIPQQSTEKSEDFARIRNAGFVTSLGYNTFGRGEAREQYAQFAGRVLANQEISQETRVAILTNAVNEMKKQVAEYPDDARYRMYLGSLLASGGDAQGAIAEFMKARELSPQKQQILMELASIYAQVKNSTESEKLMKEAYTLDPTNPSVAKNYAFLFLEKGQMREVEKILVPIYGDIAAPDARFINYFLEKGNRQLLILSLKRYAEENASDIQLQFSLAAAYFQVGDKALSIAQLEDIGKRFPEYATQTKALIGEIKAGRNPLQQ